MVLVNDNYDDGDDNGSAMLCQVLFNDYANVDDRNAELVSDPSARQCQIPADCRQTQFVPPDQTRQNCFVALRRSV